MATMSRNSQRMLDCNLKYRVVRGCDMGVGVGAGLCSALHPLQRGCDTPKISPRQLIRETQAATADMFVVVRLFWLQRAGP